MARIAFLGLGAMSSRMALRLIGAGHALTVWNRSPGAVAPLVAAGAQPVVAAAHEVFERARLAGQGKQNMTAVVQLFGPPQLAAMAAT